MIIETLQFPATEMKPAAGQRNPDACWLVRRDGQTTARCSLWWVDTPLADGKRTGVIGHYQADDIDSGVHLLARAESELRFRGCQFAVGPMNQNTWHDYRLVVESNGRPAFFLEPSHNAAFASHFVQAGFHPCANYFSALVPDLTIRTTRLQRAEQRLANKGIVIRELDRSRFVDEMRQIHDVASIAFGKHRFFQPLRETDFLAMYQPLEPLVRTELVLLAEHQGRVIGFCFAIPDRWQWDREGRCDTVIVKTFGVLPVRTYAGLGQWLLEQVHHRAANAGFRYAIHALVACGSPVERISRRYADPFRRYALFGRELAE